MSDVKPEEIRFGACYAVSKREYDANPGRVTSDAEDYLRNYLSYHLQKAKSEKHEGIDRFELRMDVYVATPEIFWGMLIVKLQK